MLHVCETCKWRSDDFTSACTNGDSEYRADFVDADDSCECWEERESMTQHETTISSDTIVIPCKQCFYWSQFSMEKIGNYGVCCHEHTPCFGKTTEGGWFCGSGEKEKDTTNSSEVKSEFT